MTYTYDFGYYNARRYSKPWIARICAWPIGQRPTLEFGSYIGNDNGGTVEISAEPGDVIRIGQRDYRGNGSMDVWTIANPDGTQSDTTASEARAHYRRNVAQTHAV
jgi:hypothetical protein